MQVAARIAVGAVVDLVRMEGLVNGFGSPIDVGKKGVVKDINIHINVINDITDFAMNNGFDLLGLDYSPVKGPEGNIEYLMYIRKSDESKCLFEFSAGEVVRRSHEELDK